MEERHRKSRQEATNGTKARLADRPPAVYSTSPSKSSSTSSGLGVPSKGSLKIKKRVSGSSLASVVTLEEEEEEATTKRSGGGNIESPAVFLSPEEELDLDGLAVHRSRTNSSASSSSFYSAISNAPPSPSSLSSSPSPVNPIPQLQPPSFLTRRAARKHSSTALFMPSLETLPASPTTATTLLSPATATPKFSWVPTTLSKNSNDLGHPADQASDSSPTTSTSSSFASSSASSSRQSSLASARHPLVVSNSGSRQSSSESNSSWPSKPSFSQQRLPSPDSSTQPNTPTPTVPFSPSQKNTLDLSMLPVPLPITSELSFQTHPKTPLTTPTFNSSSRQPSRVLPTLTTSPYVGSGSTPFQMVRPSTSSSATPVPSPKTRFGTYHSPQQRKDAHRRAFSVDMPKIMSPLSGQITLGAVLGETSSGFRPSHRINRSVFVTPSFEMSRDGDRSRKGVPSDPIAADDEIRTVDPVSGSSQKA